MMVCENSSSSSSSLLDDDDRATATLTSCDQDSDAKVETFFPELHLPDVTFIVDGIDFPCHTKILNQHCPILRDIVSIHGVQRRLSKKQRIIQKIKEQRPTASMTMPSATTVVDLQNVENKVFRALLEFLYTGGVPSELYWSSCTTTTTAAAAAKEEDDDGNEYDDDDDDDDDPTLYCSMRFLQRLLIAADRFDIVSLKHEIEYKLYDEFLYSFTAAELFVWADSHSCAFLKEKTMDRICQKSSGDLVEDFVISKDGWTIIRESKRLLEELFLYARYAASHGVYCINYDDQGQHKSNPLYYYKVEYLRKRLSDLQLNVDGTREMLEERLKPHLEASHCHCLPTRLVDASQHRCDERSERNTGATSEARRHRCDERSKRNTGATSEASNS